MKEFERIEKRFKELRNWLLELQSEDPNADRDDEHDSHNLGLIDLHEIKLAFFALVQERDRLRAERDEARRMFCNAMASNSRLGFTTPRSFAEDEGWDCFKEATGCSNG
jgi:uncharacterized coiled-coil DUF342 family protein